MTLERSIDLPVRRRSPHTWLLIAVITTGLAVTTSALAILATPRTVERDRVVHVHREHRVIPSVRPCPLAEQEPRPLLHVIPLGGENGATRIWLLPR